MKVFFKLNLANDNKKWPLNELKRQINSKKWLEGSRLIFDGC